METRIHYTVSMPQPESHHLHVDVRVTGVTDPIVRFVMPVWTPGSYSVNDFAGKLHGVKASGRSGRALRVHQPTKSSWEVRSDRSGTVLLSYRVLAFDSSVHGCFLDHDRAAINGASAFAYVDGAKNEPVQVTFRAPARWKDLETGLSPVPGKPGTYKAADFDELVDCPVMMGNFTIETFRVQGVPHRMVYTGPGNYDLSEVARDTRKIVEAAAEVFGEIPYDRYVFFMDISLDGGGGLEHKNSTHMVFPRWGFRPRKEYVNAIYLIAHEFFHTWNVKRLRPSELGPFDYTREVYTTLLWFSEGFTSYYDFLLPRRADVTTPREFLDELGREILRLDLSPGRHVQSLEQSSFDTWTKLYKPHPDSPNTTISYYNKGALFGFILDLAIRERSRGRRTLDDLMRQLYRRTYKKEGRGFTTQELEDLASQIAGSDLTPLFDTVLRSTRELDYDRYLGVAGLEIVSKQERAKGPRPARGGGDDKRRAFLGLRLRSEHGQLRVGQVLAQGPCLAAGLSPGDELIAVDGHRVDEGRLGKWLAQLDPGRDVRVVYARGGEMREARVSLAPLPLLQFAIEPRRRASELARRICASWTGTAWSKIDRPSGGVEVRDREKVY